jgi:hypothetical protein
MSNNLYVERKLGAIILPYNSSWQLDYGNHQDYDQPGVQIINDFLDIIEKIGIQV